MTRLASLVLTLSLCAGAASTCPWAGGSYSGDERVYGLKIAFTVNDACTEMSFQSSGNAGFQPVDTPQTFALSPRHNHWEADINGARATFASGGNWVEFFANGNNVRVSVSR